MGQRILDESLSGYLTCWVSTASLQVQCSNPTGALLRCYAIMSADECGLEHSTFRSVAEEQRTCIKCVPCSRRYSYGLPDLADIRYPTAGPGLRAARSARSCERCAIMSRR